MNLELKKFDMKQIKDDKVVVLIGKRDTGKSFLTRDLLYYHQDIPAGVTISGTEAANSFYTSIMPPIFIHDKFRPEIVSNLLNRQKKILGQIQKEMQQKGLTHMTPHEYIKSGQCSIDPRVFLILDDCLYDKGWVNNEDIRCLFMNGRHYFVFFIITMQYSLGVPPNLRTNIDFVFVLRENNLGNRKRLFEQYAGMFPSYEVFCQVMDQCTENYECLVINNNSKSNKLEDQVFWYKADEHGKFQLGHPMFWKYHIENFSGEKEDENTSFDTSKLRTKKNSTTINVKKSYY